MNNDDATIYNNDENRDISKLFGLRSSKLPGLTRESAWTSLTARLMSGLKRELTVNSPVRKKPKKPRQQAAQSILWL